MHRLCCYEDITVGDVIAVLNTTAIDRKRIHVVDMKLDGQELWRIGSDVEVLIILRASSSGNWDLAGRLSKLFLKRNPLCIVLDVDVRTVKSFMRFENLKQQFSTCSDIIEDVTVYSRDMLVFEPEASEECYEFL